MKSLRKTIHWFLLGIGLSSSMALALDEKEIEPKAEANAYPQKINKLYNFLKETLSRKEIGPLLPRETLSFVHLEQVLEHLADNPLKTAEKASFLVKSGHTYAVYAIGKPKGRMILLVTDVAQDTGLTAWLKIQEAQPKKINLKRIEAVFMTPVQDFCASASNGCKYYLAKHRQVSGLLKYRQPVLQSAMNGCEDRSVQ